MTTFKEFFVEIAPLFNLVVSFYLGYLSCMVWHFYLDCREDWRKDNE